METKTKQTNKTTIEYIKERDTYLVTFSDGRESEYDYLDIAVRAIERDMIGQLGGNK